MEQMVFCFFVVVVAVTNPLPYFMGRCVPCWKRRRCICLPRSRPRAPFSEAPYAWHSSVTHLKPSKYNISGKKPRTREKIKTISLVKDLNKASEMLLDMLYDLDKDWYMCGHAGARGGGARGGGVAAAECMAGRKAFILSED